MSQTQQIQASDSIEAQDPHAEEPKKTKSRRPANTAFRQQRLKAWQPILTPKTVLPLFFIVGIIFAPIGGLLIYASSQVQELAIEYTDCNTKAPLVPSLNFSNVAAQDAVQSLPSGRVTSYFKTPLKDDEQPKWGRQWNNVTYSPGYALNTSVCVLQFVIPNNVAPPILFYYRLTNFYQNHRRYVKSLDTDQLKGKAQSASAIKSGDCDPLELAPDGRPYYPCGLIANSLFNDTYSNLTLINEKDETNSYNMTQKGISWSSEGDLYGKTKYKASEVVPPPNWQPRFANNSYSDDTLPDLHTDEAFQVWMRTAGLPSFSKLAMRNDHDTLPSGTYWLMVNENFPVSEYGGTKSILISTRTVMGGKNPFLGIAYCVVGGLCILLGALFTATHLIKPRKLGDHTYLSWNTDQPSTATATGRSIRPGDTA